MRDWLTWLWNLRFRIGRRGASLLFFALLDIIYCISLLFPPKEAQTNPTFVFIKSVAPLGLWAALWAAAGILCLRDAFRASDKVGFAAAIAIKVLWGLLFIAGMFLHVERAYVSATIWLCLAGWVAIISSWPEPPPLKLLMNRSSPTFPPATPKD